MRIEKVLFPTKFTELAFNSLETLLVLKQAGLRDIVLCYIIPRDEVAFVPFGGYMKKEEERLRAEASIRFGDWQRALAQEGIATKVIIEVGDPVPSILSIAAREKVDLVVSGKPKQAKAEALFIGSHTLDILRRSTVPVLVHKYMVQFEWNGEVVSRTNARIFEQPLLATDWSTPSEKALTYLLSFKGIAQKAIVAHVIGSKIAKGLHASELARIERESRERLERSCAVLRENGIEAEAHLSAGNEVQEILSIAREFDATMITLGTTGKDRLREFFLGSVSHRVAEISELPTLLIP